MQLTETIEYVDQNNELQYFEVILNGEVDTIDDSYDDEFGTVTIEPYKQLKDFPKWDFSKHSFEENWIIAIYIYYNFLPIEKLFCDLELSFINDYL